MYLKNLSLVNFKNYHEATIDLSEKINCFVGNNGVGKTNLLDAIHYLSLCKSYFSNLDSQNIKHGEEFFVIQGTFHINNSDEEIFCSFKKNSKKTFKRNKKEYDRLADHIGFISSVIISPNDSTLITEGSEERRKLIDSVISQTDKTYLENLIHYNRILLQRNKLLKNFADNGNFDIDMLDIYSEQLIPYGEQIHSKRKQFIDEFIPVFQKYYQFISEGTEKVSLDYHSQLNGNNFNELLNQNISKDRVLEYTSTGIHKDDLILNMDGFPVKRIASQGQQKTYLVALKMAEFDFLSKARGSKPILMLDDIFDKFDPNRVRQIIKLAADEHFGQIFITDTEINRINTVLKEISFDHKIFTVSGNGSISNIE